MLNIILFGAPGAGKGTISEKLVAEKGLVHLSTGELLRDEIKRGTPLGIEAAALIDKGNFVSDEMAITIVRNFVRQHMPCKGFIFDGFPRTENQIAPLDEILAAYGTSVTMLLSLEVTEENIIKRLQNRARIESRADDADIAIIRARIATYHKKTESIGGHYKKRGLYYTVDSNITPEYTMEQLHEILGKIKE